jgi:hypothetical protein
MFSKIFASLPSNCTSFRTYHIYLLPTQQEQENAPHSQDILKAILTDGDRNPS